MSCVVVHHAERIVGTLFDFDYLVRCWGSLGCEATSVSNQGQKSLGLLIRNFLLLGVTSYSALVARLHLLEDAQIPTLWLSGRDLRLVSVICFRNKREVELSVLLLLVVTNQAALDLFIVDNFVHLDCHVIDFIVNCHFRFFTLSESFCVHEVENGRAILITLQEVLRLVLCANKNHAQVVTLKASIDVELELI